MALLLAVGGTGQHIALAAARLVYLQALKPLDVVVIDADRSDKNEITKALTTFAGTSDTGSAFPFLSLDVVPPLSKQCTAAGHFWEIFAPKPPPQTWSEPLFEAFFDPQAAGVTIQHGMYGHPAVGATVFADASGDTLKDILSRTSAAEAVFVAGSFIGGTGAGIMHELLRELASRGCASKTWLVALLQWLKPAANSGDAVQLSETSMKTNMQFGCTFLSEASRAHVQGACLLGIPSQPEAAVAPAVVEKDKNKEYPHLLHAAACWFVHTAAAVGVTTRWEHQVVTLLHDPERPAWLKQQEWAEGRTLEFRVQQADFREAVLDHLLSPEVRPKFRKFGWMGTSKTAYNLALWRSIDDNQVKGPEALFDLVWREFERERDRIRFVKDWVKDVLGTTAPHARTEAFRKNAREEIRKVCETPLLPDGGRKHDHLAIAAHFLRQADEHFIRTV